MNIDIRNSGSSYNLVVEGVIKSISDSQEIKDAVGGCEGVSSMVIDIKDSFSVTSSVIGFLLKKRQADGVNISIIAHDDRLYDLFKSLNLVEVLNVRKA